MNLFARTCRQTVRLVTVFAVILLVTACSIGGSDEQPSPTVTPTSERAQPTTEAPGSSLSASPALSGNGGASPAPPNIDVSGVEDTPVVPAGSPAANGATTAPVSGSGATTAASTPVVASPVSAGADGTGGPSPATPGTNASPASSPAAVSTVTSCDVEAVPPFGGETDQYQTTSDVNFREGPGTDCPLVGEGVIGAYQTVTVIGGPVVREGEAFQWVQVRIGDLTGWVVLDFLEPVS